MKGRDRVGHGCPAISPKAPAGSAGILESSEAPGALWDRASAVPGQGGAEPCLEGAGEPQVVVEQGREQLDPSTVGCGLRGPPDLSLSPLPHCGPRGKQSLVAWEWSYSDQVPALVPRWVLR